MAKTIKDQITGAYAEAAKEEAVPNTESINDLPATDVGVKKTAA